MRFSALKLNPLLLVLLTFLFVNPALAQNPVKWSLESDVRGKTLATNEKFKAVVKAEIESGWHLYALDQPEGGPVATILKLPDNTKFKIDGKITSPAPITRSDSNFVLDDKPLETKFFEKTAEFNLPLLTTADTAADDLAVNVRFQACNDTSCLPPKTVKVTFAGVEDVKKTAVGGQPPLAGQSPAGINSISNDQPPTTDNRQPTTDRPLPTDLWSFLWVAASLGALSLLTPCVFPMIPITVSYFTNHASHSRARAVKLASIYSLGIVATFTILGMLLAIFIGASGIQLFSTNPYINLLIAAIFLFFAFNLFGAYEIQVPTGVLNKLDSFTRSKEGEGGGIVGALLMGLTFTLTSFTCTSPFVGTVLVKAAQGDWQLPLVGMLAFSIVFALPFFVLALAPQLISQLPRAGGWMNSVKVTMGFLEVAAAMKFISNVDLVWHWGFFTRSFVLAIWMAIGIILSIYLLGKFQLPHDSKPERIGAIRVMSAILSLAVSLYLLTGLFGAKLGELESFLPPDLENASSKVFGRSKDEPSWISNDLEAAKTQAKAENKRVFVDFTGYTCTNCRWMEANVFPKREVEAEMGKFVLARLYTDGEGEVYERQQMFQEQTFKTVALPYYAILDPDGKIIATFPGLTRNVPEFVDFLKKAQNN